MRQVARLALGAPADRDEALLAQVGHGHTGGRLLGGEAAPQSRGPDRAWPHRGSW